MTEAEQFVVDNPKVLSQARDDAQIAAGVSQSLDVNYFRFDDNSVAIVTSWQGDNALVRHFPHESEIPSDLAWDHIPEEAAAGLAQAENEAKQVEILAGQMEGADA